MSQMAVLDVGIGLVLMFVLLSLLVTTAQEWIASFFRLRAKNLYKAIDNLLADPQLAGDAKYKQLVGDLYRHPLIQSLYKRSPASMAGSSAAFGWRSPLPSYIPSRTFAIALLDVLRGRSGVSAVTGADTLLADAERVVSALPASELKTTLALFVNDAGRMTAGVNERAELVSKRLEQWFNDSMSRASGWYKRTAQAISFAIAFSTAVLLNADTLHVADRLWKDSALRATVVASAEAYYQQHGTTTPSLVLRRATAPSDGKPNDGKPDDGKPPELGAQLSELERSSLPIGWDDANSPITRHVLPLALVGWLLTAVAGSLGAAFWFDLLGKALQIRGSGKPVSAVTGAHVEK